MLLYCSQVLCLCFFAFANVWCYDDRAQNGNYTANATVVAVAADTTSNEPQKTRKRGIGHYNPNPMGWGGSGVGSFGVPTTPVTGYGVSVVPAQGSYGIPVQGSYVPVQGSYVPVQGYGVSVVQSAQPVPYPVPYDRPVPYPVGYDRPVPYPVNVERPVPYPVHVDRPLPYPVNVDRPVPYPVQVEKPLPYPVHVDRPVPYPVQVTKPLPYPVHVDRPYPVQVDRPVPYPVHVPYKVSVPVDRPYPVQVPVPTPYPVDRPVPYPVQVPVKVPVVQQVPYEVSRPYPVVVTKTVPVYQPPVVQQQPVLWQGTAQYPVYVDRQVVAQQPVLWQKSYMNNNNNYIGTPVYNGGNQAGYQTSPYPSGYTIGVNHALIGLGVGGKGGLGSTGGVGGSGTSALNFSAGNLLGAAFNVMQGLTSPGGSVNGYATGHNDYLGPKTTGFTTNISK